MKSQERKNIVIGKLQNPNYLEIKKRFYFKIPCSNDPNYLKWKLSNFLKFLFSLCLEV